MAGRSKAAKRAARLQAEVAAAVCLACLDVALDQWQQGGGVDSLADLIDDAIAAARSLEG